MLEIQIDLVGKVRAIRTAAGPIGLHGRNLHALLVKPQMLDVGFAGIALVAAVFQAAGIKYSILLHRSLFLSASPGHLFLLGGILYFCSAEIVERQ